MSKNIKNRQYSYKAREIQHQKGGNLSNHAGKRIKSTESETVTTGFRLLMVFVSVCVVFLTSFLSSICYPETIKLMERHDFFVATKDYYRMIFSDFPGLTNLLTYWLLQFFGNPLTGGVLEALLLALLTMLVAVVPLAWRKRIDNMSDTQSGTDSLKVGVVPYVLIAVVSSLGLFLCCAHSLFYEIQGVFFFGSLCLVGLASRVRWRALLPLSMVVVAVSSLFILIFPLSVMLMAVLSMKLFSSLLVSGTEVRRSFVTYFNVLLPLVMIGIVVGGVFVLSDVAGFIPFNKRWWSGMSDDSNVYCCLILFALPVVLGFLPRFKKAKLQMTVEGIILIIAASVLYVYERNDEKAAEFENMLVCSALAEDGKWTELLDKIKGKGAITNKTDLHFALLAEARLGTLADNLFSYPINTPEDFCPRLEPSPLAVDFCRMFYRELGVWDEAYRQAFEYGMKVNKPLGFCFSSLRHMAEYCVKQGNKPLAEKYLYLLSRSSCHADFVAEQRRLLENAPTVIDSVRTDNFVKAFPMNKEMAHLLDYDHNNLAVVNYLLCGLLLSKQLEAFKTVLSDYAHVFGKGRLPRAYAEAAAMINYLSPGIWAGKITYDPEYDRRFAEYVTLHNNKQDDTAFQGTFWYYYSYASIPPLREWQDQAHDSTT